MHDHVEVELRGQDVGNFNVIFHYLRGNGDTNLQPTYEIMWQTMIIYEFYCFRKKNTEIVGKSFLIA